MRLLDWNVNGRIKDAARRQVDVVLGRSPDLITLQEVTDTSYPVWCAGLLEAGYSVVSTVELVALPYPAPPYSSPPFPEWPTETQKHIKRKNFNLTAARHPIAGLAGLSFEEERAHAFPEKHVVGQVAIDGVAIDVHNAHLPPGVSRGLLKVYAFEAIARRIDASDGAPTLLGGDFNAPASEDEGGPVRNPGDGPASNPGDARWDDAETSVLQHPRLRDVYRDVHDPQKRFPASHFTGRAPNRTPRRYDYIFASRHFRTERCEYLTDWLERGLSDHAAVEADLLLVR